MRTCSPQKCYPQRCYPRKCYPRKCYPQRCYPGKCYPRKHYPRKHCLRRAQREKVLVNVCFDLLEIKVGCGQAEVMVGGQTGKRRTWLSGSKWCRLWLLFVRRTWSTGFHQLVIEGEVCAYRTCFVPPHQTQQSHTSTCQSLM